MDSSDLNDSDRDLGFPLDFDSLTPLCSTQDFVPLCSNLESLFSIPNSSIANDETVNESPKKVCDSVAPKKRFGEEFPGLSPDSSDPAIREAYWKALGHRNCLEMLGIMFPWSKGPNPDVSPYFPDTEAIQLMLQIRGKEIQEGKQMFADLRCSPSCARAGVHGTVSICPPDCFQYKGTLDVFYKIIRQILGTPSMEEIKGMNP